MGRRTKGKGSGGQRGPGRAAERPAGVRAAERAGGAITTGGAQAAKRSLGLKAQGSSGAILKYAHNPDWHGRDGKRALRNRTSAASIRCRCSPGRRGTEAWGNDHNQMYTVCAAAQCRGHPAHAHGERGTHGARLFSASLHVGLELARRHRSAQAVSSNNTCFGSEATRMPCTADHQLNYSTPTGPRYPIPN